MNNMTAAAILKLLREKHKEDVFVPECKTGQTTNGLLRLDAWAMAKSWAHPVTWGYEIKVSRSDFAGDTKWHNYLPYCSEFYFVAPRGIISPDELPSEAGLLLVADTGTRLFMKKKAPRRAIDIPEDLFRYILMARAVVTPPHGNGEEYDRRAKWRRWLEERREGQALGFQVSKAVAEHCYRIEREIDGLRKENEALSYLKTRLDELGVNTRHGVNEWTVQSALSRLSTEIPPWVKKSVVQAKAALDSLRELLDEKEV